MYHSIRSKKDISILTDYLNNSFLPQDCYTEKKGKKRSSQSNRYLHGILFRQMAKFTGHSLNYIKGRMSIEFALVDELPLDVDEDYLDHLSNIYHLYLLGETIYVCEKSSRMNQERKGIFISNIREWAKDFLELEFSDPSEDFKTEYELS